MLLYRPRLLATPTHINESQLRMLELITGKGRQSIMYVWSIVAQQIWLLNYQTGSIVKVACGSIKAHCTL